MRIYAAVTVKELSELNIFQIEKLQYLSHCNTDIRAERYRCESDMPSFLLLIEGHIKISSITLTCMIMKINEKSCAFNMIFSVKIKNFFKYGLLRVK